MHLSRGSSPHLTSPHLTHNNIRYDHHTRLPWLERTQQSLAPAGGVVSLEPSPLPSNIQAAVFSWREIGRYEAAEMREVCRGGGHECVAELELDTSLYVWSGRVIASLYNTQDRGQSYSARHVFSVASLTEPLKIYFLNTSVPSKPVKRQRDKLLIWGRSDRASPT